MKVALTIVAGLICGLFIATIEQAILARACERELLSGEDRARRPAKPRR